VFKLAAGQHLPMLPFILFRSARGMSPRKFTSLCHSDKVSKTFKLGISSANLSQMLTNEPKKLMVNPYATSIYGCIRKQKWMLTPPGWLAVRTVTDSQGDSDSDAVAAAY
jgi:hypothetical protein